jgi:8-oxo-dGTP diphosphatase
MALSVKMILLDKNGRCLLLKRSMSSKGNPGKWDLPGGKIDLGETFDQALLREVMEETGLNADVIGVAGTSYSESPTHKIIYLILEGLAEPGDVQLSDEHEEYAWVHPRELPQMDLVGQFKEIAEEYARK